MFNYSFLEIFKELTRKEVKKYVAAIDTYCTKQEIKSPECVIWTLCGYHNWFHKQEI